MPLDGHLADLFFKASSASAYNRDPLWKFWASFVTTTVHCSASGLYCNHAKK
jgi:hypothetical protein